MLVWKVNKSNPLSSQRILSLQKIHWMCYIYLFGPSRVASLARNLYALVVVDDYSRFTWTLFLAHKHDAYSAFKRLAKNSAK